MSKREPQSANSLSGERQSQDSAPLRQKVLEALLSILEDPQASAAARASAGRTLLEYFDTDQGGDSGKRGGELTLDELDAEITRLSSPRHVRDTIK